MTAITDDMLIASCSSVWPERSETFTPASSLSSTLLQRLRLLVSSIQAFFMILITHASRRVPGRHWSRRLSARSMAICTRSSAAVTSRVSALASRRRRGSRSTISCSKAIAASPRLDG